MLQPSITPAVSSFRRMTAYSFLGAVLISAASSAPTPLYHLYQEQFHLSQGMITLVFGSYAFALIVALLTLGSLSDYLGRRPLIVLALLFNAAALGIFMVAQSGTTLILARIVQGFATGVAFPTFGATILDTDKKNGPVLNSITAFLGLMIGTLSAGAMVELAPYPLQGIYALLLLITIAGVALIFAVPETISPQPGALAAMRPHVSIPLRARSTLLKVTPINVAGWSLGGFYLSLMPTLVTIATGIHSPFVGGSVVAALMLSATSSVFIFRKWAPQRVLFAGGAGLIVGVAVTLLGIQEQAVGLLFLGTAIAGLGFGSIFSNILKIVLPLAESHERAGLFAAFLVESYLAFAVPAIIAGLAAPAIGLFNTTYIYGAAVAALAALSLAAARGNLTEQPKVVPSEA